MDSEQTPTADELKAILDIARRAALANGAKPFEADEVAQQTVIRLSMRWNERHILAARQQRHSSWGNYVAAAARNIHRDSIKSAVRRQARERRATGTLAQPAKRPGTHRCQPRDPSGIEQYLARKAIEDEIQSLPGQQRQCAELFFLDSLSTSEVAEILNIQAQTVRKHLRAARKRLRLRLTD